MPDHTPAPPRRSAERPLAAVQAMPPDFELLFRSAPTLLAVLEPGPELRILAASDAYLRASRCPREAAIGRPFFEVFPESGEGPRSTGAGSLRAALDRVLASGKPDALNTPVFSPDGRMRYIIHRMDAMELELLRSVRERDAALARLKVANEELDAFVQCTSRELRGPIHEVGTSCRLFGEMRGPFLDGETRRLLTRIGANVNRMESIIDGLLGLSRVARVHMARRRVDVTAVARRVVAGLAAREPERAIDVQVADGLEAWADENLVRIVLENVIGNAWKYTRRRRDARIAIGAGRLAGQAVFHVRDNGVGFDMAQADRLFTPFVRLHDANDFEGHGIGLTSAKRIVERHGGEIWAEAQVGEGATIHFTLGGERD